MKKIKTYFELIKFEHTVFALPFAYLGMWVAAKGAPGWKVFLLVTLVMAGARSAGMTLNRLIDMHLDAKNPRTKNRSLVTGEFKTQWAWLAVGVGIAVLFLGSALLNPLCLKLAPLALFILTAYHYAKRFTFFCHWILGLVLGCAPMGGWIAVTGQFAWQPVLLALAVTTWVGGFDILYSAQDMDFDRVSGLHSVPVRYGLAKALWAAAASHGLSIFFFACFGWTAGLGWVYAVGLCVTAVLLRIEHSLVTEDDLSKINTAFFTINGWIGVLLFVFTGIDLYR